MSLIQLSNVIVSQNILLSSFTPKISQARKFCGLLDLTKERRKES